jgi:Cu/Ag efflux protein CusF
MRRAPRLLAAVVVAAELVACSKTGETGHGEGVVVRMIAAGLITIEHGDIPGVMKASTVEYEIERELLVGLRSGDRVAFTIERYGGRYHVTQIRKQGTP